MTKPARHCCGKDGFSSNPADYCNAHRGTLGDRRFSQVLDVLERYTPEQRAELFYIAESKWCWDCGKTYDECDNHGEVQP
jgi:hypothetical protein